MPLEWLMNIVLRSGLVQGPGFGFWSGHWVGPVSFFFKLKWCRFSKKNKSQQGCNRILTGQPDRLINQPGQPNFFFSCFFFNPVWFQHQIGRVPDGSAGQTKLCSFREDAGAKRWLPRRCSNCHYGTSIPGRAETNIIKAREW